MKTKIYTELESTHTWLKNNVSEIEPDTLIIARAQTAGRGQRGNSWEAEPDKNLTFSFLHYPQNLPPRLQFAISEALSLAILNTLSRYGILAKIKWPNDIYVGHKKICGILIDHAISNPESIDRTIAGAGLNINQRVFRSNAPNPVSMADIAGHEFSIPDITATLCQELDNLLPLVSTPDGREALHSSFMANLYRGDGNFHPYRIVAENRERNARIVNVDSSGPISLKFEDGTISSFAFKEIEFILPVQE
ncbi:MAG: biotin--[acetyl-CoA-carboxylase] ligase [Muribaculaceae bacterium]|nr:biotin--[acetyl-CoA-carboxylase] ligase [Muribaculaceae bacterium]